MGKKGKQDTSGFIYLAKIDKPIAGDEGVYKMGRTKDHKLRKTYKDYKGYCCTFYSTTWCAHHEIVEIELKKIFKKEFKLYTGYEYFKGNYLDMKKIINDFIWNESFARKYLNLKYCEYFIFVNDKYMMFNAKTQKIREVVDSEIIENTPMDVCIYSEPFEKIDISLVDAIFEIFIVDKNILLNFKRFCHYLLVEDHDDVNIFYDKYMSYSHESSGIYALLMIWIESLYSFLRAKSIIRGNSFKNAEGCRRKINGRRPILGVIMLDEDIAVQKEIENNVKNIIYVEKISDRQIFNQSYDLERLKIFVRENIDPEIYDVSNLFDPNMGGKPMYLLKWCINNY